MSEKLTYNSSVPYNSEYLYNQEFIGPDYEWFLGNTLVKEVYLGSVLIYQNNS